MSFWSLIFFLFMCSVIMIVGGSGIVISSWREAGVMSGGVLMFLLTFFILRLCSRPRPTKHSLTMSVPKRRAE